MTTFSILKAVFATEADAWRVTVRIDSPSLDLGDTVRDINGRIWRVSTITMIHHSLLAAGIRMYLWKPENTATDAKVAPAVGTAVLLGR